jgi:hypothetical protein
MSLDDSELIEIPIPSLTGLADGAFYEVAYMLASNKKSSITDPSIGNSFIPLPNGYYIVQVVTSSAVISIMGHMSSDGSSVEWELYIRNVSTASISITSCYVYIRYADNDILDPMEVGEDFTSLGTITVAAGADTTKTGSFPGAISDMSRQGKLWFRNSTNSMWNTSSDLEQIN